MSGENLNYCHNCMRQLDIGAVLCPYCGHDNTQRHNHMDTLHDGRILNGKYLVGCVPDRASGLVPVL